MIDLGKEIAKQNANIVVHIYGDGELKDEFQAALNQNGLQNILKLHGFESDKEKNLWQQRFFAADEQIRRFSTCGAGSLCTRSPCHCL